MAPVSGPWLSGRRPVLRRDVAGIGRPCPVRRWPEPGGRRGRPEPRGRWDPGHRRGPGVAPSIIRKVVAPHAQRREGSAGEGVGKHRNNRTLMENFSVEGRHGDLQTWFLGWRNRRPHLRAIDQVGMFEVDCSLEVDHCIAGADSKLEGMVRSIQGGQDPGPGHWGEFLESMAVQFVRSASRGAHIQRELDRLVAESKISPARADDELNRLLAHRDVGLFRHHVDCAASDRCAT